MQTKPILTGLAAAILILVISAASFSAGLYFGQRGYVAGVQNNPQMTAQQRPAAERPSKAEQTTPKASRPSKPEAAQLSQSGPTGAPSWPPDALGHLISLTADSITIQTQNGQVTLKLSASTKYTNDAGKTIPTARFAPGNMVAVFGKDTVTLIMRLPQKR